LLAAGAALSAGASAPSAAAAGTPVFDVRGHGAVGDGAADDTRAIQATIDATPSGAGVVSFPPGVYRITAPLNVIDAAGDGHRRGLRILGSAGGASGAGGVTNVEMMGFDTCYFGNIDEACVFIASRTGQSKAHRFYKCGFSFAPFGIFHETGSFVTFGCAFGYHTDAAVRLGSITDYIAINESDSEGCARFLKTGGGSRASWAVKINGARLALNGLAADGRFIDFTDGGPLILENVLFGDVPNARFRIRAHAAEPGSMLLALGNVFPNDSPFDLAGRCRLIAFGNRGFDGSGRPVPLDDEVSASGDAAGRLTLSTVGSIS